MFWLNSASPRRRQLMDLQPFAWQAIGYPADESGAEELPAKEQVLLLARRKAEAGALHAHGIVIGCDTLVEAEGRVLGKPKNEAEARGMLRLLSGGVHRVYTGLCLIDTETGVCRQGYEETRVHVAALSEEEIARYIASGEPFDKAGGYGIQGGFAPYVTGIEGCYYNVVGLPLARLYRMMCMFENR